MVQTLVIQTDNEQALEAVKALALELGLKFTSEIEDNEDEDDAADIAIAKERRNDERIDWETAKKMLAEGTVHAL